MEPIRIGRHRGQSAMSLEAPTLDTTPDSGATALPPAGGSRFPCFDGLRAIAALAVLTFHVTGILDSQGILSAPHWVTNALSRLGLFGVGSFFVISGFLLYRPFAVAALTGTPSPAWFPFWKRRFFRIYPAYWVALAVAVFVLGQGGFVSVVHGTAHFAMIQNYRAGFIGGGLTVAWTLGIEISFYIVLPFVAKLLRTPTSGADVPPRHAPESPTRRAVRAGGNRARHHRLDPVCLARSSGSW